MNIYNLISIQNILQQFPRLLVLELFVLEQQLRVVCAVVAHVVEKQGCFFDILSFLLVTFRLNQVFQNHSLSVDFHLGLHLLYFLFVLLVFLFHLQGFLLLPHQHLLLDLDLLFQLLLLDPQLAFVEIDQFLDFASRLIGVHFLLGQENLAGFLLFKGFPKLLTLLVTRLFVFGVPLVDFTHLVLQHEEVS